MITSSPSRVCEPVAGLYRQALHRYGPAEGELLAVALLEEQAASGCGTASHVDQMGQAVNPRLLVLLSAHTVGAA